MLTHSMTWETLKAENNKSLDRPVISYDCVADVATTATP